MKAGWFETFGDAKDVIQIGERAKPKAGPGEVLVKLKTSSVNPSDVKKRAGAFPNLLDDGPVIPHSDGAGVIEAVGEGISRDRIGERVWVYQAQFARSLGTAAEYVALDSKRAPNLPDKADFNVGACLGIPVMTAHRCVHSDGDIDGQLVLVTGGAGRVGYYAIQWAKMAGAKIIATASNEADEKLCYELGAFAVVNHKVPGWGNEILNLTDNKKVQRVIDVEFGANLPEILKCIGVNGIIATYSSTAIKQPEIPFLQMMYMDLTVRMIIVYAMPESAKEKAINDINDMLAKGLFKHRIAAVLPLSNLVESHELIEQGNLGGCVIITT